MTTRETGNQIPVIYMQHFNRDWHKTWPLLEKKNSIFVIYRQFPFRWCICLSYDSRGDFFKMMPDRSPIDSTREEAVLVDLGVVLTCRYLCWWVCLVGWVIYGGRMMATWLLTALCRRHSLETLQCWPLKLGHDVGDCARFTAIVADNKSGRTSLDHLQLPDVLLYVWIPCSCSIFEMWTNKCPVHLNLDWPGGARHASERSNLDPWLYYPFWLTSQPKTCHDQCLCEAHI